jgi:hypothetical protein
VNFRNKIIVYGEELLTPRPTPKMEDHSLLAVRDCLFNIFAATLHIWSYTSSHINKHIVRTSQETLEAVAKEVITVYSETRA